MSRHPLVHGLLVGLVLALLVPPGAHSATNQATDDPGGGGFLLSDSGTVTVTATPLNLIKQVWVGGSCRASSDISGGADSCNGNTASLQVPAGTTVEFLIYVRNRSDVTLSDIRIEDLIDDAATGGFSYTGSSITITNPAGLPADTETAANLYAATSSGQSDTLGVGPDDYAAIDTTASPDRLTVGAVAGQANNVLTVSARSTFAVRFAVTKNSD